MNSQARLYTIKTSDVPFPTFPESSTNPEHFIMMTKSKTTPPVPDFPMAAYNMRVSQH